MPKLLAEQTRLRRSITRYIALGFLGTLGVVVSVVALLVANQHQNTWINHTLAVQQEIANLRLSATQLRVAALKSRLDKAFNAETTKAGVALDAALIRVGELTSDNPRQQARVALMEKLAGQIEREAHLGAKDPARDQFENPQATFRDVVDAMGREEAALLSSRLARQHAIATALYILLAVTGAMVLFVAVATFLVFRRFTDELQVSRVQLREANEGLEAAVQERTTDLMRANSEIQRFAYIVSHDLRSPLVNVMGFTAEMEAATASLTKLLTKARAERPETVADEAIVTIEQDLPEAIHFIRASTQKMDRLINAILHVSRLGNRQVNPMWIKVPEFLNGVVAAMQIRVDEAGAKVNVDSHVRDIYTDRTALEQILSNLLENAIKYSSPERSPIITLRAQRRGERVFFDVADNGRGIDARDHERVFDLFRRSGAQDKPGEGIGLANVRALTYRLGGLVTLQSQAGVGSTFTVDLPYSYSEEQSEQHG